MRARLEAALRRLGPAGVVALGILVACAAFYTEALRPAEEDAAARRAALERQRLRTPYRPVSVDGRAEDLRRFHALFPPSNELNAHVERLHRLARRSGLDLAQGDYRLERRTTGLWAYRVTLPVRGGYAQVRGFMAALLREMPTASLEGLRFERRKAAETELDAQLRITLHLRPSVENP